MKGFGINQVTGSDSAGHAYAHLLRAAGVTSISELGMRKAKTLTATLESVNEHAGLTKKNPSLKKVKKWIAQARELDPLAIAHAKLQERLGKSGKIMRLDEWNKFLQGFPPPDADEMRFIVDQTLMVIQDLYVHLAMKKIRRAVNPVQSLRLLRQRIEDDTDHLAFHSEMLKILKSLGDIHTAYRLPEPYRYSVAFLPLLIQKCYRREREGDKEVLQREYIVTNTLWEASPDLPLKKGDEIIRWNGMPMHEAVISQANIVEGSNHSAMEAFALQSMTMRWLGATFPPRSPWVILTYRDSEGREQEVRLAWRFLTLNTDPKFITSDQYLWYLFNPPQNDAGVPRDGAVNPSSQIAHIASKELFVPEKRKSAETVETCRHQREQFKKLVQKGGRKQQFKDLHRSLNQPASGDAWLRVVESWMPSFLQAWIINIDGYEFGHIRIRGFPFSSGPPRETSFVTAFRSLLAHMPHNGLILDVRGNPGGSTKNAEMLLQLICPKDIQPLPFQFLSSALTKKITSDPNNEKFFGKWASSVDISQRTASMFSKGFPITNPDDANYWGQEYFGPVVLLTSATTYSAADFISASFDDHEIGPIIGVNKTTGGGGANVWFYREHLTNFLPENTKPIDADEKWPTNINLQFAARRSLRIGKSTGIPIEELGVETQPHLRYRLTRRDLLEDDYDLRHFAAGLLAEQHHHDLHIDIEIEDKDVKLTTTSINIDWLEIYIDGRIMESHDVVRKKGTALEDQCKIRLQDMAGVAFLLELRGYEKTDKGDLKVARYKHLFKRPDEAGTTTS
jgi:C-terminal processing protease CtpA/Prc